MQCDYPYHIGCLDPPLDAVPDGEWFCPECEDEPGAPVAIGGVRKPVKRGVKSKAMFVDDEEDEHTGQKRKAPAKKAARKSPPDLHIREHLSYGHHSFQEAEVD